MKAILYDVDGLLTDTERIYFEVGREIAKSFGKEVSEETLWKMMGRKPIESAQIFVDDLGLDVSAKEIMELRAQKYLEKLMKDLTPMKGMYEILKAFQGKYRQAIATGSPEKVLVQVLEKLGIREYFEAWQTSDGIQRGKPDPEIYVRVIKKLNLSPKECIVLEDASNGALAGKTAGCYVIAVPSEYTVGQDFSFVDYIARDLNDAAEHIRKKF